MWIGTEFGFTVEAGDASKRAYPAVLLPAFTDGQGSSAVSRKIAAAAGIDLAALRKSGELTGTMKEFTILHARRGSPYGHVLVLGCGRKDAFGLDDLRSIVAKGVRTLRKIGIDKMLLVAACFPQFSSDHVAEAAVDGAILGLHKFKRYLKRPVRVRPFREITILVPSKAKVSTGRLAAARARELALATVQARELAFEPANRLGPEDLVAAAEAISRRRGLSLSVLDPDDLATHGMNGILAVASGSRRPCYLIDMLYRPDGRRGLPRLTFVGKGVTFDSGGISIKPSLQMHHMKYDMAGAAAVLEAVDAVASLGPDVEVRAILPTAENMPDGHSYRPSDVIEMHNGSFVEVTNTDAEGRLLLADALSYACGQGPDAIVDVATLTGAVLVALGTTVAGIMGTNRWLIQALCDGGEHHAERFWELPLYSEYLVHMKSTIADIANAGPRYASTITAGKFLETFVDGRPWAHLDIAGTAWSDEDSSMYLHKPYLPKRGPTGFGVRTLAGLALKIAEESKGSSKRLRRLLAKEPRKS